MQRYSTHEVAIERAGNSVLRNTYGLLALTLAFSGLVAFVSQQMHLPHPGLMLTLAGFYGLFFATVRLRNSGWGLLTTFALTGFMGYTLGPILGFYMATANGSQIVMTALGGTAVVFFGLSGYALVSRKDFSFLSGFMVAGFFVILAAMLANIFLQLPALQLMLSAAFMLFSSAAILMQTGAIVNGGERNYILATVTLYVSLYNIFISLLNLLTAFSGDE